MIFIGPFRRTNSRAAQRHRPLPPSFNCANCCCSSFFGSVLSFCSLLARCWPLLAATLRSPLFAATASPCRQEVFHQNSFEFCIRARPSQCRRGCRSRDSRRNNFKQTAETQPEDCSTAIVRLLLRLLGSAWRLRKETRKMTLEQRLHAMESKAAAQRGAMGLEERRCRGNAQRHKTLDPKKSSRKDDGPKCGEEIIRTMTTSSKTRK